MTEPDIKDAIVTREYDLANGAKVQVYIWKPVLRPTGEYGCEYQIVGIGKGTVRVGYGFDSMQALVLTLNRILMDLSFTDGYKRKDLTWLGGEYLGLPVPKHMREDCPED